MTLLLDTSAFLFLVFNDPRLSATAREHISLGENEILLSPVSAYEIAVKHSLGKLPLALPPATFVPRMREQHGIGSLALSEEASLLVGTLPHHHRDPFDRLLVCQALDAGIPILTPDPLIAQYAVSTLW